MKTNKNSIIDILLIVSIILFLASCKKENSEPASSVNPSSVSALSAIAVGVSGTSNDSIYVIRACANGHRLDSISSTSLPSTVTDYLAANYAGYVFQKAFTDKDSPGNTSGYVAIILFDGNPVGLKFDAAGTFVRVLEQREGRDLSGNGWHKGGCFDDRDGRQRDTIGLALLPTAITAYFTTNYPQDTLVKAFRTRDSSYLVYSINDGAFATQFDANGTFIRRVALPAHTGNFTAITESGLPASIGSYLSTTYPNYVLKQAFSFSENGTLPGYVVCIDANGTRYAVEFDASGNVVNSITIK